jgi:hypothetical protein
MSRVKMIQVFVLAEGFHKQTSFSTFQTPLDKFLVAGKSVKPHPTFSEAAVDWVSS